MILADFAIIFADFSTLGLSPPLLSLNPTRHSLSRLVFEGIAERAVMMETTLRSQLLGSERLLNSHCLAIETDKMPNAQIVNIGIVIRTQTGEILAEIETVGSNGLGQLEKGQVVLQVETSVYAIFL